MQLFLIFNSLHDCQHIQLLRHLQNAFDNNLPASVFPFAGKKSFVQL